MHKSTISPRNACFLFIVMIITNNVVLAYSPEIGQDAWVAIIGSTILACPLVWMYARLIQLQPGKSLFEMATIALGKWGGRAASLFFTLYTLLLGSLVLYTFAQFIHMTSLYKTPVPIIELLLFFAILYLAKSGSRTLSRFSMAVVLVSTATLIVFFLFSIPKVELKNLLPILQHEPSQIALNTTKMVFLPLGETVVLLTLFGDLEEGASPYKVYFGSLLFSGIYTLIIFVRSCSILGANAVSFIFFPNYRTVALIEFGDFLERIESLVAFVYILGSLAKTGICLLGSARGIAHIFGLPDDKAMVFPVGFLMVGLSAIAYKNILQMFAFANLYMYFALPFHVAVPLILWAALEIRRRKDRRALEAG